MGGWCRWQLANRVSFFISVAKNYIISFFLSVYLYTIMLFTDLLTLEINFVIPSKSTINWTVRYNYLHNRNPCLFDKVQAFIY